MMRSPAKAALTCRWAVDRPYQVLPACLWLIAMTGNNAVVLAPEIAVSRWFNTSEPLTLSALRGRPVLLHAFQMLCPGCAAHGTPQTQRAFQLFKPSDLQVSGRHTGVEHHAAMPPVSLEAFIREYKLTFPIGVD